VALGRHIADPAADGLARTATLQRFSVELDRAGSAAAGLGECPSEVGLAGADDPADAEHLAGVQLEGDVGKFAGG
jgi:hypothetical protein